MAADPAATTAVATASPSRQASFPGRTAPTPHVQTAADQRSIDDTMHLAKRSLMPAQRGAS